MDIKKYSSNYRMNIKSYYKKSIDNTFSMWPHSHEYMEIMDVISGSCFLEIYENKTLVKSIEIKQNTIVIIASSCYHRIRTNEETILSNLEFAPSQCLGTPLVQSMQYLKTSNEWKNIFSSRYGIITISDINGISSSIDRIILRLQNIGLNNDDIYLDSSIFHLFVKLSECYNLSYQSINSGTYYFNKATSIIKREISNNISVKEIAKELNVTVSYLERVFKECINTSIKKYSDSLKIELIKKELIESEEDINKICFKYGYNNMAQLIYQFKQVYNCTPRDYRKNHYKKDFYEGREEYLEKTFEIEK